MSRSKRREQAKNTLEILKKGQYINSKGEIQYFGKYQQYAEQHTELWTPASLEQLLETAFASNYQTGYFVVGETTLDATRRLHAAYPQARIAYLNFASAKNPGGGFLNGSLAQEECIAKATGLYPCQLTCFDYYDFHRKLKTCLYSDHMIYSPKVPIIKDEAGQLLDEPVYASIVTSAAVNAGVVRRQEPKRKKDIIPVMRQRIDKLLSLLASKNYEVLVLGAWGCGVFMNQPEEIAQLFKEALENRFKGVFKQVEFAVYSKNPRFITPFQEIFGN